MPRNFESIYGLMISRFAETLTMYVLIVWAGHAYELHDRSRIQAIEQSELKRTIAESELQMLKTQLHPHFLFNTLQGISSLTEENPKLAKQMVVALGDLLRAALKHSSVDLVSLQTEMEFVSAYLDLEKMRLGDRLTVRTQLSADAREYLVPQLVLQPLVENAIVHGIANSRNGGWIQISSELNEQHLRLADRKQYVRASISWSRGGADEYPRAIGAPLSRGCLLDLPLDPKGICGDSGGDSCA